MRCNPPAPAPGARASARGLVALAGTLALAFQPADFRWTRAIEAPAGAGPVAFDADAPLFAAAGPALGGLRVVDARGRQVPWRPFPPEPAPPPRRFELLDRGTSGGAAVALLDLGRRREVHDRIDLELPGRNFAGVATVAGSDDRRTFTTVGSSRIFDVAGANGRARSTAVTFSPSDVRYLRLHVTGVHRIDGAIVSGRSASARAKPVAARRDGNVLDLGGANVPVDLLRITAATPRYDRRVRIEARAGSGWRTIAQGRIYRLYGKPSPPLELATRARYLRVTILNGDDPPLAGVRLQPLARPRTVLVEGGHGDPLRLLYGGRRRSAPVYDFARLPRDTLGLDRVRAAGLGPQEPNAEFLAPPDTRSFVERHPLLLDVALAVTAAVLGVAGFLALRRRA